MWIWQQENWPQLTFKPEKVWPIVEQVVRTVAPLNHLAQQLDESKRLTLESQILLEEAMSTAQIEGELLDRESVRSSIANRLGVGQSSRLSKSSQAFVDVLLESIRGCDTPLLEQDLFRWHNWMFMEKPVLYEMAIGDYRDDVMQVVSGRFGKQTVHFEAPCDTRDCVRVQMRALLDYVNTPSETSLYVKAALAKFWFVTVHPFDDGNGRFSRILAERLLAKAENTTIRLYSLSAEIDRHKAEYYQVLEHCQKGSLDITDWVVWFLRRVLAAAQHSYARLEKIQQATVFWDKNRGCALNERQRKLLIRLLETEDFAEGIARQKYKSLAHTTDATAARDLKDLVDKGVLYSTGKARATRYHLRF